jgi:hypothetical protein
MPPHQDAQHGGIHAATLTKCQPGHLHPKFLK